MLTDGLISVVRRLGTDSIRLIVFNIDQQAELMRSASFAPSDAGRLRDILKSVALGTIDYRRLQARSAPQLYIARLIEQEASGPRPPDRIVLFGSSAQIKEGRNSDIPPHSGVTPPCYYLEHRSHVSSPEDLVRPATINGYLLPSAGPPVRWPDPIEQTIRRFHGRTLEFSNGQEFAAAIETVANAGGR